MRGSKKLRRIAKDAARLASPRGEVRTIVVLGCQRSGTNALIACFDNDPKAKVFPEFSLLNEPSGRLSVRDSRRYSLRLRPLDEVAARIDRVRYPLAVLKPLAESQRSRELLVKLPRTRIVWIFRHYQDVAESNARTFGPEIHHRNLAPIASGDPSDWRSEGAREEVREFVAEHYRPGMDPLDGGALFWWARNQLLFDQGLDADARVRPLQYERMIADPALALRELYDHAAVPFPGEFVADGITPRFSGRGSGQGLSPPIRECCEELWARLIAFESRAISHAPTSI